jgi:predicted permease
MRAYRWLLHLYPASFRAEYGDDMCVIFARERRTTAGARARAALWGRALGDTLANAPAAHADMLRQDLRDAFRSLRRAPGFAATAVLVAGLGIGTATAAFSVTDHVLFGPLPFPDAGRLVKLWEDQSTRGYSRMELSPPNYRDWERLSSSFESMAAFTGLSANLAGLGDPRRLEGAAVSASLFRTLGRQAALGRAFIEADGQEDAPLTVVLSDALWQTAFGADPRVLGRAVTLNDATYVVIGVMPGDFLFPTRDVEFWTPLRLTGPSDDDRANYYLRAVARLAPGVPLAQARAEMQQIAEGLAREYPADNEGVGATVVTLRDEVSQQPRLLLAALIGAALCVLLIACTNLANLLLSRALARRHEMAVRAAIGARVDRLVRQMLTESVVLSVAGGALGVILAIVSAPLVSRLVPNVLPIAETPGVDFRMLAFAALATLVTAVVFGLLPALRVCRSADAAALRDATRTTGSRQGARWRAALVVAEITASVVLLVSAGLLIQALWKVQQVDPGFTAEGVLTVRTTLPLPKYEATVRRDRFYHQVIEEVEALPGVARAAYISFLPMTMRGGIWPVEPEGASAGIDADRRWASLRFVTPGFFDAMRTPILSGRDVALSDTMQSPFVAVVSESFARQHWPDADPIGRQFHMAFQDRIVVGVAGNIKVRGLERESEPQVYLPSSQVPDGALPFYSPQDLVIRASVPLPTLVPAVRAIVAKADPQQPLANIQTMTEVVDAETAPRLTQLRVLGAFAALAFLLAGVGIYGLLAFTVSARTREIGVRMALGAGRGRVLAMILGHGVRLATLGIALGAVLAVAAGQAMQSLLAGVNPTDTQTLAGAAVLALLVTLAGSLVPALRAAHIDPLVAMRAE